MPSPTDFLELLQAHQELVLANALLLGEFPSPSGGEEDRIKFLAERFSTLQDVSIDEQGNLQAIIPGKNPNFNVLIAAHADTLLTNKADQRLTINVGPESITGPGMADNTIGLATLATIPDLFEKLGIQPEANIILLAHTKSQNSHDLAGLRFFLENFKRPIHAGLVLEGITLGRLNHSCLGMVQADVICRVHQEPGTRWEAAENAMIIMHRIIRRILEIPIPQEPRTSVILGSLRAGKTFNRPPELARLKLEIRSEEPGKAREIRYQISDILDEISSETASDCSITFPALRKPGGIPFNHPLVAAAREVQEELGLKTTTGPSYSDLSILIEHEIPALTIGLTTATNLNESDETVALPPLLTGLAQVFGILQSVDTLESILAI
ncbi:M20/M25/M40 family metallo-hydrolase [Roseibacillus persicicus]|uniref:Aminoacyl-histidine dipeptidase n=1 Tax=Roseibacillus persicicus TaxID=454148 RepID=A0A918TTQ4_9BACT|nr:M20/M25/M40 family metallo-hydrolase [Roseibacillus persicicus]MDQ8191770.1 M20/M25/M40 family metallo-hydrolase [Roseibacillus persicicus]GHC58599.1 aminoacyl-histidine dipeptidase [Roseibacillus persicicus]